MSAARIPAPSPIDTYLQSLHARYRNCQEGDVADYIPELAKADPNWFGICMATRDGHLYETGDTQQAFTIQSISKALVYGLALEDRGEAHVLARISVEPSGDAFNAISLKPESGVPFNPMINAGAIATCGQVLARDGKSRIERVLAYLSGCAGRELDIDPVVYRCESETGHRNRAIGWLLRNFNIIDEEPTDILETYFQQCAIRVTCRDLAMIGATLANQGINPLTRKQAIAPEYVDNILSVMSTCGMYDFSGEWLYRIGLPAKSGVGGGILAVLPGQLGIGIFSPPLDAQGNSARGIHVCADLSQDLALHLFHNGTAPQPAIRLGYDNSQVSSRCRRPQAVQDLLRQQGPRVQVLELQGELVFSTIEPVIRALQSQGPHCQHAIVNLRNVVSADQVSLQLLAQAQAALASRGIRLLICHPGDLEKSLLGTGVSPESLFADDDAALEDCENRLLTEVLGERWRVSQSLSLAECELLAGLAPQDVDWLDAALEERRYGAGETILSAGDPGDALFLLLAGRVEVRLGAVHGQPGKRIDVFTAGMSFGEMAFIDGSQRSADVLALEPVRCRIMPLALFNRLDAQNPQLKIRLLQKLTHQLSSNLRRTNGELIAYKG